MWWISIIIWWSSIIHCIVKMIAIHHIPNRKFLYDGKSPYDGVLPYDDFPSYHEQEMCLLLKWPAGQWGSRHEGVKMCAGLLDSMYVQYYGYPSYDGIPSYGGIPSYDGILSYDGYPNQINFTPIFWYFYTNISAISVKFCISVIHRPTNHWPTHQKHTQPGLFLIKIQIQIQIQVQVQVQVQVQLQIQIQIQMQMLISTLLILNMAITCVVLMYKVPHHHTLSI